MKERSGMPYDVVAYEADEYARLLSPVEEGIFHRMLRLAWMNGSIPSDLTALADLCRVRPTTMQKAWVNLSSLWHPVANDPSRLENKKQKSERIFLETKRKQNRKAANLKWKVYKEKKNASANADHSQSIRNAPQPSPSLPIPLLDSKSSKSSVPLHSSAVADRPPKYTPDFEQFWERSTKRGSKFGASKAWQIWKPNLRLAEEILAGMFTWKQSEQWQDETKQPHISTWLKRRGWEEIVPRNGSKPHQEFRTELDAKHSEHTCQLCDPPHSWPCADPDDCDMSIELACPEVRQKLTEVKP